jgi:small-conductance mechanosensitive channel
VAFFQSSFLTVVATAGTALLSLSFVFAVTTQEFLGSCIFLFVKHPYDVADRVDIVTGGEKLNMIVDKISLLYTVFTRIDKMQVVQIPNIQLNNLCIENVTRSKAMKEAISVKVAFDTSFEDVELLRAEMEAFVCHSDNSRDFQPDLSIGVSSVGNLDALELSVVIKHKSNWHNDAVRGSRRSKFICALALALKKIPVYGPGGGGAALGSSDNPSYSVAVSDQFASKARTKAADDMDAKRMVPTNTDAEPDPTADAAAQQDAANNFNKPKLATTIFDDYGYDQAEEQLQHQQYQNSRPPPSPSSAAAAAAAAAASNPNDPFQSSPSAADLRKTPSSGGRRKPGEGVSTIMLDGQPALALSPSSPVMRGRSFDEEAQLGVGAGGSDGLGRSTSRASAMSGFSYRQNNNNNNTLSPGRQWSQSSPRHPPSSSGRQ